MILPGKVWQLLPTTPGIDPNCAVIAEGNNLATAKSSDLFDFPWLASAR
jgi:hypothetical protein